MKTYLNKYLLIFLTVSLLSINELLAANSFVKYTKENGFISLISNTNKKLDILSDNQDNIAVKIALENLKKDIFSVAGVTPNIVNTATSNTRLIVGTLQSLMIQKLIKSGALKIKDLKDKNEMYVIQTLKMPGQNEDVTIIVGSDRRGTVYGIYELSQQIGVSPWYWWADVPIQKHDEIYIKKGTYTDGEPAVRYRGLFLNDEAPCLTSWVKNTYGTNYGGHQFYAQVFELILRLKGNFLWPAMWMWSFYGDDPLNSKTADEMGVIMGTSHHEPMARNHQEWVRKRNEYGAWDYASNQKVMDDFFKKGIQRSVQNEDLITIGMRGDGDTPIGGKEGEDDKYVPKDEENLLLLEKIIKNQRQIIKEVTGKPAEKRPQVWALYKEVLRYYDMGLKVPDDVIILLSDDNWGDVRRLPNEKEQKHQGGWGMYYHVDYVGAPRNSKWLNVTPIQNIWEQFQLTYQYGVDKLWVLNVGDLKPMEYPISLFMDMAWNPNRYTAATLLNHTYQFCQQQFGAEQAEEAARILNLYSKYNGRVTPEMLNCNTYNLETGEWKQVSDEYCKLEAEALRQYLQLDSVYKDAYQQLILFPVQAMANLYEMYYAQAMNHKLYKENNPQANMWADKVEKTFKRDAQLCREYNEIMANGKWNGMMTQKHIGYTIWNDNFKQDILPQIYRFEDVEQMKGGYIYTASEGVVSIEAEHYYSLQNAEQATWSCIPYMGRTLSAMALMPYNQSVEGAALTYKIEMPQDVDSVIVYVITKSTLAFKNKEGHRYSVGFEGGNQQVVNFNADLNEEPENIYSIYYPTVSRRIVEKQVKCVLPKIEGNTHSLILKPMDPGIVFEKVVIDCGGYKESYLFMNESSCERK